MVHSLSKFALAIALPALIAAVLAVPAGSEGLAAGKAPRFWIANFAGERYDSRKYEGATVVSFFFVDCVPCIKEIPELHKLISNEYPDTALLFIDPIGEDSPETIKAFAARLGVPERYFYHDPLGRLAKKFFKGRFAFPTIIGINDGQMLFRLNGLKPESLATIRKALPRRTPDQR